MKEYCIYLRKSRADAEEEARGAGETLARHRARLMELANRDGYPIAEIYQEIVSGDTIAARPQMQRLLADVEAGRWAGVLVAEVERLARGDTIDQGIVSQAFKYSGTKIITPMRIYDPNNEFDEEYFEFGLFMARREYSAIKRRLQAGRLASAREGKYQSGRTPYGYRRKKLEGQKGWTLEIDPEDAAIVRMIFDWYLNGLDGQTMGGARIARKLNEMGLRTKQGCLFEASHIRNLLQNETYIGKIRWNQAVTVKGMSDGKRTAVRKKSEHPIIADGLHEPIIDEVTFARVQQMFASHKKLPKNTYAPVSNPLSGLVKCGICGRAMIRKPSGCSRPDLLHCMTPHCKTTGIYIPTVEKTLLDVLQSWVSKYSVNGQTNVPANPSPAQEALAQLTSQLAALDRQIDRLYDLLESGTYSEQDFVSRRAKLMERRQQLTESVAQIKNTPDREAQIIAILPRVASVLDAYHTTNDMAVKNELLRSVISRVIYHKTKRCYRNDDPSQHLTLDIYPVILHD